MGSRRSRLIWNQTPFASIREQRRWQLADRGHLYRVLREATEAADAATRRTLAEVNEALGLFSLAG